MRRALLAVILVAARLAAQPPAIGQNGVVNQASQIVPTLAGGALARGARIEIHGIRLTTSDGKTAVTLGGISLTVLSANAKRIETLIPLDASLGSANMIVTAASGSAPFSVEIVASNPGLYSRNGQGWGPARIENLDAKGKRSENSRTNAARPGQRTILATSGLGGLTPIRVFIGTRPTIATPRRTDRPGEEQLEFAIPKDAPLGCDVPVYVLAAAKRASNIVTMAIDPKGRCEDRFLSVTPPARLLLAVFSRTVMEQSIYDEAVVSFANVGADARFSPLMLAPPPGTCVAYSGSFQNTTMLPDSPSAALVSDLGGTGLDAGASLNVVHDAASRAVPRNGSEPGFFRARLGGQEVRFGPRALAPFLDPGEFRLSVPGGRDVPPFAVSFTAPSPLDWTNRDSIATVDRARDLVMTWRGAAADRLVIALATNVGQVSGATGTVLCTALPAAGRLTIPAEFLANLPASSTANQGRVPYNRLFLGTVPAAPSPIHTPGLDAGTIIGLFTTGRFVEYR